MQLKLLKIENFFSLKIAVLNKKFCSSLWQSKFWGGLSRTLKKALLRMSLLAGSRNYQSVGQIIAFNRAVQSLSVVIIRGSANMLLSQAP